MPINPVMNGGAPGPVEGDDESKIGAIRVGIRTAQDQSLGTTFLKTQQDRLTGDQTIVPQKDAVARLKAENYDTTGVPAEGMAASALEDRMERASERRQTADIEARAGLGSTAQFLTGLAGGMGDPLNIVIAPLGAFGAGAVRAGLLGRAAVGAAEGAGINVGLTKAADVYNKATALGDPDVSSRDYLNAAMLGGGIGGVMHGAFGPRPVAHAGGGPVTLDMIDKLGERTGNYSAKTGIPVDKVVSSAGAVGRYQVEPATSAQLHGFDGKDPAVVRREKVMLQNSEYNRATAQLYLDQLNKRFPNDPEAVAIAYNAGPGRARQFIRAGRDYSVLPAETRAYAARFAGVPRDTRIAAAKTALAQTSVDSPVNVAPVIDNSMKETFTTNPMRIADEHADEVMRLEGEAMQRAVPKRDSAFTDDPATTAQIAKTEDTVAQAKPAADTEPVAGPAVAQKTPIDPELAEHVTNDVQQAKDIQTKLGVSPEATDAEKASTTFEEPEHTIDGLSPDEHVKAVQAAVHCGLLTGGFE